jgi:hypothetical protein
MNAHWYTVVPAFGTPATLLLGLITLRVNGARAERQRKRDLHARALAAITAYGEMPYRIRRRGPGRDAAAQLSDELSVVKAEIETCQVLLAADGDEQVSIAYDALYATARQTVGHEAHAAWEAPIVSEDAEMNQGDLYRRLKPFNTKRDEFAATLRTATLPRSQRISRALRATFPVLTKLPGVLAPPPPTPTQVVAPQDLATTPPAEDDQAEERSASETT